MCVASAVHNQMNKQWDLPNLFKPDPVINNQFIPFTPPLTKADLKDIVKVLEIVDRIDKKLKTVECTDDRKDRLIEMLWKRIEELENK